MPICKHLKPVGDCLECRPKTEREIIRMVTTKPKFGLVRDVVQKINGKAKPKERRAK